MFFSKTVLISVLGLSALAVAAPIENGVAVEAAPAAPCSWLDNILGRDCDSDEDAPRAAPRPTGSNNPRPSNSNNSPWANNNPYPNQPYTAPVSSTPRPVNGQRPRPVNGPRPITAPNNDGTDALGQSSWCNRPDPARRPASCGNGGTATAPRSTSSSIGQDIAEQPQWVQPQAAPAEEPVEEDQN